MGDRTDLRTLPEATADTATLLTAERALLDRLGGGCHVPIGARARVEGTELTMIGVVASLDGSALCRSEITGPSADAAELGKRLAERLLEKGAAKFLMLT